MTGEDVLSAPFQVGAFSRDSHSGQSCLIKRLTAEAGRVTLVRGDQPASGQPVHGAYDPTPCTAERGAHTISQCWSWLYHLTLRWDYIVHAPHKVWSIL